MYDEVNPVFTDDLLPGDVLLLVTAPVDAARDLRRHRLAKFTVERATQPNDTGPRVRVSLYPGDAYAAEPPPYIIGDHYGHTLLGGRIFDKTSAEEPRLTLPGVMIAEGSPLFGDADQAVKAAFAGRFIVKMFVARNDGAELASA